MSHWSSPNGCHEDCPECSTEEKPKITLDYSQIEDAEVDGIDPRDYPDFCDAYISSATYMGREMTDEELEVLNDDRDFVYDKVVDWIF